MWFFLSFLSAIFSAGAAVSQKKVLFKLDALLFSLILSGFNFLLLLPVLFFYTSSIPDNGILVAVIIKTFLGNAAFLFVMKSLRSFEISTALPLMALTPGIVAVISFFLLGDVIGIAGIAGLILMVVGTYFLESSKAGNLLAPFREIIFGKNRKFILFALAIFSLTAVLDRLILWKYKLPPVDFLMIQQTFSVLFFAVVYLFSDKRLKVDSIPDGIKAHFKMFLLIAVMTLLYRYFQMEAVKLAPAALVLSVKRLSILFASLAGGKIFKETALPRKIAAIILILTGLFLLQAL